MAQEDRLFILPGSEGKLTTEIQQASELQLARGEKYRKPVKKPYGSLKLQRWQRQPPSRNHLLVGKQVTSSGMLRASCKEFGRTNLPMKKIN